MFRIHHVYSFVFLLISFPLLHGQSALFAQVCQQKNGTKQEQTGGSEDRNNKPPSRFEREKTVDQEKSDNRDQNKATLRLFLTGDVMTGRGIDQILPYQSDPVLYEAYVQDARTYIRIAERANGPIEKPVGFDYIWGVSLNMLEEFQPHMRLINLETSITTNDDAWPGKGINYRMSPKNCPCLTALGTDYCSLANNHVLDWGGAGLAETLRTLEEHGIKTSGAGLNMREAQRPTVLDVGKNGRSIILAVGSVTSGIPSAWRATDDRAGVFLLSDYSDRSVDRIKERIQSVKREGDIAVVSIHWGSNWGYAIPEEHVRFAHNLIDTADVDLVWGHSSHHPRPIEVYHDKLVLYGCGDFLNDYEGIGGREEYRGDLTLMYFVDISLNDGKLKALKMVPLRIKNFRLHRASPQDTRWLSNTLDREGRIFGTRVEADGNNLLNLVW